MPEYPHYVIFVDGNNDGTFTDLSEARNEAWNASGLYRRPAEVWRFDAPDDVRGTFIETFDAWRGTWLKL